VTACGCKATRGARTLDCYTAAAVAAVAAVAAAADDVFKVKASMHF